MFRKRASPDQDTAGPPVFPTTLERFNLCLKDGDLLCDISTGKPYLYEYSNDETYNSQRYEAILGLLLLKVEEVLINEMGFLKQSYPVGSTKQTSFLYSQNAFKHSSRTILLINGLKGRRFCWSTFLLFRKSFCKGSFLSVIRYFMDQGYEFILSNPNENYWIDQIPSYKAIPMEYLEGDLVEVDGSTSPEDHITYLFETFIIPSELQNVFVIAHEYGGHSITTCIEKTETLKTIIKAIALLHSAHSPLTLSKLETKIWFKQNAVNWISSKLPLNDSIQDSGYGCNTLSSGGDDLEKCMDNVVPVIAEFFNSR